MFSFIKVSTPNTPGEECCVDDGSKQVAEGNCIAPLVPCDKLKDKADVNTLDNQLETINSSVCSDIPAPEKLLSVPEVDTPNNMSMEATPAQIAQNDGGTDTSVTGKKRSFTESSLTMQSLNTVDSSAIVHYKTTESVPDDDDLLSSILGIVKDYPLHCGFEVWLLKIVRIVCLVFLNSSTNISL